MVGVFRCPVSVTGQRNGTVSRDGVHRTLASAFQICGISRPIRRGMHHDRQLAVVAQHPVFTSGR
ncbi:hypothetical protein KCP69_11675 [Salmonella enterica subsp. enterica]|nr:hypothetical protein KCP69_11675 [Salmonella enterica subsp. enterica]